MKVYFNFEKPYPIKFSVEVHVTQEGMFNTTLPEEAVKPLQECGVKLQHNRLNRLGFFSYDTLEGLKDAIKQCFDLAGSEELIEEKEVIRYQIIPMAHYFKRDDGALSPNGYCGKGSWASDDSISSLRRIDCVNYGMSLYTSLEFKKVFKNKLNKIRSSYEPVRSRISNQNDPFENDRYFLCAIVRNQPNRDEKIQEIDATPEALAFFVARYKELFAMCENAKKFVNQDSLLNELKNGLLNNESNKKELK